MTIENSTSVYPFDSYFLKKQTMSLTIDDIANKFKSVFKETPQLFRAPGRINIIGEHTDYNDGFVLPTAINKEIYFAIRPNDMNVLRVFAVNLNDICQVDLTSLALHKEKHWVNYLLGVYAQLQKHDKPVHGVDVVFGGNIPVGAGISSSAAIECGFLYALNSIFSLNLSLLEITKYAQAAEHEYAGVKCGIMDQYAVMFSKSGSVFKLDCRELVHEYVQFSLGNYSVVLCDSGVKHKLASTEYNKRRQECAEGLKIISSKFPSVSSFRDVTLEKIESCKDKLADLIYRRCSYVIEENTRVENMCKALSNNDLKEIGKLLYASHGGLQYKYEVSCPELDELVEISKTCEGIVGSRMMGGGFGGCTLNIVHNDSLENFVNSVRENYFIKKNIPENIIIAEMTQGVSAI